MNLSKDLPELVDAGIVSQDTADRILEYYQKKANASPNKLFIAFGVLGAVLVALGVILIVAHNWDDMSRPLKTAFAFLPLLAGQLLCGFVLIRRKDGVVWREGSASFLFLAVAAAISLISQVYNIPGNLTSFLLTWMCLGFPLVYVMNSSVTSLLYIAGITYYATQAGYWTYPSSESYWYWFLLAVVLPHYYRKLRQNPQSNFVTFHNWMIPLSATISLGTIADNMEELMFVAYISLFGLFYLVGHLKIFSAGKRRNNGFLVLGSVGTVALLMSLSFNWFWEELDVAKFPPGELLTSPEFYASLLISLFASIALYRYMQNRPTEAIVPVSVAFILFLIAFVIGLFSPVSVVLINLYVLAIGIFTIRSGARQGHLGILNYGLLIISALVVCRFFDTDLSFIARGILFVVVGLGFFATNYWVLKKRRKDG